VSEIYLNGENVEYVIRDLVIAEKVSEIAAIKEVREFAVAQQQKMGSQKGIIMDAGILEPWSFPAPNWKFSWQRTALWGWSGGSGKCLKKIPTLR